jgi:hypothetical protein
MLSEGLRKTAKIIRTADIRTRSFIKQDCQPLDHDVCLSVMRVFALNLLLVANAREVHQIVHGDTLLNSSSTILLFNAV